MFGALNRFISVLDAAPPENNSPAFGFQVLRNTNDNGIEPWFDYIIGDNPDPSLFATEIRNCAGSNVELSLWSAKGSKCRSVWVTIPQEAALGLAIQWTPLAAADDVWHVLDVAADSPADEAGLLPYGDYIIGSPEGAMNGKTGLEETVERFVSHPLRLWVYNHEYNVTRLVTVTPRAWGGEGALGCTTAHGALHRIPPSLEEPPQGPGETLFETTRLIPADSVVPKEKTRKKREKASMDEYFQEGEEKSREVVASKGVVAPPPKAGS